MKLIGFAYLYRYASNDKVRGLITFANPDGMAIEEARERLRKSCLSGSLFIAEQVMLDGLGSPETPEDGPWHEFVGIGEIEAVRPNDPRTLREFVKDVEAAAWAGWEEPIPEDPLPDEVWEAMVTAMVVMSPPGAETDFFALCDGDMSTGPEMPDTTGWMPFDLF